jgi:hypothetical protein
MTGCSHYRTITPLLQPSSLCETGFPHVPSVFCFGSLFNPLRAHHEWGTESSPYWLQVTVTVWYYTKRPMQLRPFSDQLYTPSEFQLFSIHPPEFSALDVAEAPSGEGRRNWARNCLWILPTKSLFHTSNGSLTRRKILWHGTGGFTSTRRKSYYGVLLLLQTYRSRRGLNPRTLGPVASTITITPPRTTVSHVTLNPHTRMRRLWRALLWTHFPVVR